MIEDAKWISDHDYYRIGNEFAKLPEGEYKQLEKFINRKVVELSFKYERAWLGEDGGDGIRVSDDGWMDLTAEVVGRGEQFYNSITVEKLRKMAHTHDYHECFTYCLL